MSSKRLQTDLGPLSLALVEVSSDEGVRFERANASDVLRLNGLLKLGHGKDSKDNLPDAALDGIAVAPDTGTGEIKESPDELVEALFAVFPGYLAENCSAAINLCLDSLGDITVFVTRARGKFSFELQTANPATHQWLNSILDALSHVIGSRLGSPVSIRILDPVSQCEGVLKTDSLRWMAT